MSTHLHLPGLWLAMQAAFEDFSRSRREVECMNMLKTRSLSHLRTGTTLPGSLLRLSPAAGEGGGAKVAIWRAITAIEQAGFHVWFGEYEDRVPVARDRQEALSEDPVPIGPEASVGLSYAEPVAVLAIGKADLGLPKVVVDLSHTAWLGPDYRDC
jgi:hypothetical protein